jgi:hypothetical protein
MSEIKQVKSRVEDTYLSSGVKRIKSPSGTEHAGLKVTNVLLSGSVEVLL